MISPKAELPETGNPRTEGLFPEEALSVPKDDLTQGPREYGRSIYGSI